MEQSLLWAAGTIPLGPSEEPQEGTSEFSTEARRGECPPTCFPPPLVEGPRLGCVRASGRQSSGFLEPLSAEQAASSVRLQRDRGDRWAERVWPMTHRCPVQGQAPHQVQPAQRFGLWPLRKSWPSAVRQLNLCTGLRTSDKSFRFPKPQCPCGVRTQH